METSDWINLIAAILIGSGTLALAGMTWRSIRQTRKIQESEHRERLLNEIIQWAEEVYIASLDTPEISLKRYRTSRLKATSILTIAEKRFDITLLKYMKKALNELVESTYFKIIQFDGTAVSEEDEKDFPESILDKITKEIANSDKNLYEMFKDHEQKRAKSIKKLIEEATKLKTRI